MKKSITTEYGNSLVGKKQDHFQNLDEDALLSVMATKKGRWMMMRLFDRCKLFQTTFTGNSQTFYNEGVRSVGLAYLTQIKSTKRGMDLYHKAEAEYLKEREIYEQLIQESKGDE